MPRRTDAQGHSAGRANHSAAATTPTYRERLTVPWWWWPIAAALAVLLAAEFHLGYPGVRAWLPYVVVVPLVAAGLFWIGRPQVRVADRVFYAGKAHVELRFIRSVEVLDAKGKREALGPEGDPAAFGVTRPWIGGAVRVVLDDPADPTPYWLVSTRRPDQLLDAIERSAQP